VRVNVNPATTAGEGCQDSTGWRSLGDFERVIDRLDVVVDDDFDWQRTCWLVLESGRSSAETMMAAAVLVANYTPQDCDQERSHDGDGLARVGRTVVRTLDTGQHRAVLCWSEEEAARLFDDWSAELWPTEAPE